MNVAIIAAAGQGTRIGGKRAKQFLELAGIPIIIHTLRAFEQCDVIQEIIVVLPVQDSASFLALAEKHGVRKIARVVPGGATRADSVWRGLQVVSPTLAQVVAVHDGVRPFVTAEEIRRTVEAAEQHDAAILTAPAIDTIKEVKDGRIVRTLGRAELRHALTPQCFQYSLLCRAYEEVDVMNPQLTDESALVERLGVKITVVEGSRRNIKITRPEDLAIAEALLKSWT